MVCVCVCVCCDRVAFSTPRIPCVLLSSDEVFSSYQHREVLPGCRPHPGDIVEAGSLAVGSLCLSWYGVNSCAMSLWGRAPSGSAIWGRSVKCFTPQAPRPTQAPHPTQAPLPHPSTPPPPKHPSPPKLPHPQTAGTSRLCCVALLWFWKSSSPNCNALVCEVPFGRSTLWLCGTGSLGQMSLSPLCLPPPPPPWTLSPPQTLSPQI